MNYFDKQRHDWLDEIQVTWGDVVIDVLAIVGVVALLGFIYFLIHA